MSVVVKSVLFTVAAIVLVGAMGVVMFVKTTGLSAKAQPGSMETAVARRLRSWAVPAAYAGLTNPVLSNEESVRNGMEHFADHCATCHANDGSGNVETGKGMFPPAPDMRAPATQRMTDGELFYVIEHGVRFTGMPGWGTGTLAGEESSWHLVNFIRHLPAITAEEVATMEALNPRSPEEIRQEIAAEEFLSGSDDPAPAAESEHQH